MALITINRNPSKRVLKWFGLMFAAFFGLLGIMIQWRFNAPRVAQAIWVLGGVVAVSYYTIPPLRRTIYLGWLYAAYPIGWTLSYLILAVVYFLVITPTGLVMRLVGYDPMRRRLDPEADSYWKKHEPVTGTDRYFHQF